MNLYQIDLNLLVTFDALYKHSSVSHAASATCISQSAFSHSLARLRKLLNDELFIRINNVMEPTERAKDMAKKLEQALPLIHAALNDSLSFDPTTDNAEIVMSATDYTEMSLLPNLIGQINTLAPQIKVTVLPAQSKLPMQQLENNELDFVLDFTHENKKSSTIESITWVKDSYCTIARNDHPLLKDGLNLENYLKLSHVRISPWGEKQGIVDQSLAKHKLTRHVALQLPSAMSAPHMIKNSDLLLTLPRLIAEPLCNELNLAIYQPPIAIPDYQLKMYWHKRNTSKPRFQWFCQQVLASIN